MNLNEVVELYAVGVGCGILLSLLQYVYIRVKERESLKYI